MLLINQNYQGYDNLDNTSSLRDGAATVTSKDDDDANKDLQLRKPQQTAVEEEPQLDFAVVGFEKTGASLDAHIMCFPLYFILILTANNAHDDAIYLTCPLTIQLYRHNIPTRSVRQSSRNHHASQTLPRRCQNMRP